MGKIKQIPDRWLNYKPVGAQIEGTRFIAFKVPLKEKVNEIVRDEEKRLDCEQLLRLIPNLGLIIDLTNTNRYYSSKCFVDKGLKYTKILTEGHVVPSKKVIDKFKESVESFLNDNKDNDKLIGVHCTHGVNRTGYLICNYMITAMSFSSAVAIKKFAEARGHNIERQNYISNLSNLAPNTQQTKVVDMSSVNTVGTDNLIKYNRNNERNGNINDWRCREQRTYTRYNNMPSVNAAEPNNTFYYNNNYHNNKHKYNYYNNEHNNNFQSSERYRNYNSTWHNNARSAMGTQRYDRASCSNNAPYNITNQTASSWTANTAHNNNFHEDTWFTDNNFSNSNYNNNTAAEAVYTQFSTNNTRNYRPPNKQRWNVFNHFENRVTNRPIRPRSERFANYKPPNA